MAKNQNEIKTEDNKNKDKEIEFPIEVKAYLNAIHDEEKKEDVLFFLNYMRLNHPEIIPVISYGIPMYKLEGKQRYVAFSNASNHYTFHSTDFDIIDELRSKIKGSGKGKGSVQLKYGMDEYRDLIIEAIETIVKRKI
ncbi:MAG: hypothetical protein QMB63_02580 [Clostridiaceae bacterium]